MAPRPCDFPRRREINEECLRIRKAYCAAAVTALLLSIAPSVFAQARDNSWEVGYFGGANFYANELKIENAFTYGIRVGYNIKPNLEIEVTYATSDESRLQQPTSTLITEQAFSGTCSRW